MFFLGSAVNVVNALGTTRDDRNTTYEGMWKQHERLYNRMFNFEIHVMKGILNLETVSPLKCVSARLLKEAPELPLGYQDN